MLRRAILNTVTGPINATSDGEFTQEENEGAVEELDKPGNTHGGHIKKEKHCWLEKFGHSQAFSRTLDERTAWLARVAA